MYVCVLLYYTIFTLQSDYDNSFDTPGFSLLKSLVMTSGEMEYEELFRFVGFQDVGSSGLNDTMATDTVLSSGGLNYFTMSTILWVVFVIYTNASFVCQLVG